MTSTYHQIIFGLLLLSCASALYAQPVGDSQGGKAIASCTEWANTADNSYSQSAIYGYEVATRRAPEYSGVGFDVWEEEVEVRRQVMRECLHEHEATYIKRINRLHNYFRAVSDHFNAAEKRKAAKNGLLRLFKDQDGNPRPTVGYHGFVLNRADKRFFPSSVDLDNYLQMLIDLEQEKGIAFNICWGLPPTDDPENFPIQLTSLSTNKFTASSGEIISYTPYEASLPILERIGYISGGRGYEEESCKELRLTMRLLEYEDPPSDRPEDQFYWDLSFVDFRPNSSGRCKPIKTVECPIDTMTFPPVVPEIVSTGIPAPDSVAIDFNCRRFVPALAYLAPGINLKLATQDRRRRVAAWPLVSLVFVGSAGAATYFKADSRKHYRVHLRDNELSKLDENFARAQKRQEEFLIAGGIAAGTFILSNLLTLKIDGKGYRECLRNTKPKEGEEIPAVLPETDGVSLRHSLKPILLWNGESTPAPGFGYHLTF